MMAAISYPSADAVQEWKVDVQPSELPTEISKAIRNAFPNSEIIRIQKEVEGEDHGRFDVDISSSGKDYEVPSRPGDFLSPKCSADPYFFVQSPKKFLFPSQTRNLLYRNRFQWPVPISG